MNTVNGGKGLQHDSSIVVALSNTLRFINKY